MNDARSARALSGNIGGCSAGGPRSISHGDCLGAS